MLQKDPVHVLTCCLAIVGDLGNQSNVAWWPRSTWLTTRICGAHFSNSLTQLVMVLLVSLDTLTRDTVKTHEFGTTTRQG